MLKAMFSLQPLRTSNLSGAFVQPRPVSVNSSEDQALWQQREMQLGSQVHGA